MTFAQVATMFLIGFTLILVFCLNRVAKHWAHGQPRLALGYVVLSLVAMWGVGDTLGGCVWFDSMCSASYMSR